MARGRLVESQCATALASATISKGTGPMVTDLISGQVQMALCLSSATLRAGVGRACNERKLTTATVDPSGRLEATLSLNIRFQAADGRAIDCGATDGYCSASLVSVADPELVAQVPLIFDPNDPRREIDLPDIGD